MIKKNIFSLIKNVKNIIIIFIFNKNICNFDATNQTSKKINKFRLNINLNNT